MEFVMEIGREKREAEIEEKISELRTTSAEDVSIERERLRREKATEDAFATAFLCRGVSATDTRGERVIFFRICTYCGCEVWGAESAWIPTCAGCNC